MRIVTMMMTMRRSKHRKMMMKNTTDKRLERLRIKTFSKVDLNVEPVSKTIASKRSGKWVKCLIIEADLVIDLQDNPAEEVEEVIVHEDEVIRVAVHEDEVIRAAVHEDEVIHVAVHEDELVHVAVLSVVHVVVSEVVHAAVLSVVHVVVPVVVHEVVHAVVHGVLLSVVLVEDLVGGQEDQVAPSLRSH